MSKSQSNASTESIADHSWTDGSIDSGAFTIPETITNTEQWVTYALEEGDDGKMKKKPHATEVTDGDYGPYVKWAGVKSPDQFVDYMTAYNFVEHVNKSDKITSTLDGMGFVIREDDPFVAIDLDDCVRDDGVIKQFANEFLGSVDSFFEISQSGNGLHCIAKGSLDPDYQNRNDDVGVEMYEEARFIAVTGNSVKGKPDEINESTDTIRELQQKYCEERDEESEVEWEDFDVEEDQSESGPSDSAVVRTAKVYDDEFERLYNGSNHVDSNGGASESDLAFVNKLSFWTQSDAAQIRRIWKNSGRSRAKLNRSDYVQDTIRKGIKSNPDDFSGNYR